MSSTLEHAVEPGTEAPYGQFTAARSSSTPVARPRIIVCGSRNWSDRESISSRLFDLPTDVIIVHGGAGGADNIAGQEATKLGLLTEVHRAQWHLHDRGGHTPVPCRCGDHSDHCKLAGFRRNEEMAAAGAVLCIAFWDGHSRGTTDMVDRAEAHGIPIELHCEGRPVPKRGYRGRLE